MEGLLKSINHAQAIYFADQYIAERKWHEAMACLFSILTSETVQDEQSNSLQNHPLLMKRAARMYAEINGALPLEDVHRQDAAAVQLLVLSRVKANEWLGTQGVAAFVLKVESTRIGDMCMNYDTGMPMLIQSDNHCAACNTPHCVSRCSACALVFYCSEKHQKEDWKHHKLLCMTSRKKSVVFWNDTQPYQHRLQEVRKVIGDSLEQIQKE